MTDRLTLSFDGEDIEIGKPCFVRVTFLNRPYPDAPEPWDRDAINCEVSLSVDAFRAHYPTAMWGHELVFMRAVFSALYERVGGESEGDIDLLDNAFTMTLYLTALGHLIIDVVAYGELGRTPYLEFSMKSDQSYLPIWIGQLDEALARYPSEVPVDVRDPLSYRGRQRRSLPGD